MFSTLLSADTSFTAFVSARILGDDGKWRRRMAACAVLTLLLCGSANSLSAQTVTGNFGSVNIGTTSPVVPLVFTFQTSETLASAAVLTQGATGLDFVDAGSDTCTANTAYTAGQSCTVNVTFTPQFAGARSGSVVLEGTSGSPIATGYLQGSGVGPQIVFTPAVQSTLDSPTEPISVAVAGNGNIYFATEGSSSVYEMVAINGTVPPSPVIKTIATGFGSLCFVNLDAAGNLYVADTFNNAVKEIFAVNGSIPTSPTIETLGSGFSDPASVAIDGNGNVYVTGLTDNTVKEMVAVNGLIPPSPTIRELGSGFKEPIGISVDGSGNVYVADSENNAVKEMLAVNGTVPASPVIKTLGGGFNTPYGLTVDGNGNVYVAGYGSNSVEEIVAVYGSIPASPTITLLGNGYSKPSSVAVDGGGNVYVADTSNNRVEKLDFADAPTLTFASTAIGATSGDSPRTVTIENVGNAALTFPIPPTGDDPAISANFSLNSSGASDCPLLSSQSAEPATLAAGASCQLPISFVPTATGALTGSLVLTDTNLNAAAPGYVSQSISLNGTGTASFTIQSSAYSLGISQGGSATSTITVIDQNGFTGSVNLSASSLPSGVTAAFSPNPTTGTSVLTLIASSTAPTGTFTVSISGTSGIETATAPNISLTVVSPAFSVYASPSSVTVPPNSSGSSNISVTYENGLTGNVNLAASGLPNGVTATFSQNPLTATGVSSLTLSASSFVAPGTYPITVTGTNGSLNVSTSVTLTVPPPSFTITSSLNSGGLEQGNSVPSTITVMPYAGFTGSVTLTASVLPPGLTASFTPNPMTGSSQLTLTASSTAPAGDVVVTILGTSGTLTASVNIYLTVIAHPPSFSLTASPASLDLAEGTSYASTISVNGVYGFNASVNLAAYNLPGGVTAAFSPASTTGSSVLTLTASNTAATGAYSVIIGGVASGSGEYETTTLALTITATPGFAPSTFNFGAINIGTPSATQSLTYTFGAPVTLGSIGVLTQGAPGLDYTNAGTGSCAANTAYAVGQSCIVNAIFTPGFAGPRNGAVTLYDNSGNTIAIAYLQGTGVGPQLNFASATQTTLGSSFNYAAGVAMDGSGNAYVVDTINNIGYVQEVMAVNGRIPANPTIATLAGGLDCPVGPALDSAGNVYFADLCTHTVSEIQAVNASIPASPTVTTLTSQFVSPAGIAVDSSGNVYVLDASNDTVNEILAVNGSIPPSPTIVTLANGFKEVDAVAVDNNGNVYVSDDTSRAVFEINAVNGSIPASPVITSLGSGFVTPRGITVDGAGNVYVAEYFYGQVYEILAVNGTIPASPTIQSLGTGLGNPNGVALDGNRNVYVADYGDGRLVKLDVADAPGRNFGSTAVGATSADSPQIVTVENVGNATLSFPAPSSGNNPALSSNFALNSSGASACPLIVSGSSSPGTLAAGASCQLFISFVPTAAGPLTGTLALTDNNLNAPAPAYAVQSLALSGTGTQGTPIITWSPPEAVTYGTALTATQLNATTATPGTFTYSPAAGTVLGAGAQTLSVTFTPTDTVDYTTTVATVALTVNPATPIINWPAPAAITYGTALSAAQLDATSTVAGTFTYSPAAGTVLSAGTPILFATFTPTDTVDYTSAFARVSITVNQATPTIAWATPPPITYGTALSAAQLDATATVAGSFSYSPAAGTVLGAGPQTLTATFTPTDSTDYKTASANTSLTVNKAPLSIVWPTPAPISYGTALSAAQLDATSTAPGTFAYSPAAGTVLSVGAHTLSVTFTPTTPGNYTASTATASVTLTVTKATPVITWPQPSPIAYGTALSATQLNATSSVAGSFAYSPAAGKVLAPGAQTLKVTFTPGNTTDYTTATASVTLTVNKATPTITWATPKAITYGTSLSATQLNATAPVGGTFAYSPASGAVLSAGSQTLTVTFTPSNSTDYTTNTAAVTLTVNKATPSITWATPRSITYGTALSATQLNATSPVAGSFAYSPAAGTVLNAGPQTLTATFTPANAADYNTATATVTLTVNRAAPAIKLTASASSIVSGTSVTFTATVTGGGVEPTGTVTFYDGSKEMGIGTPNGSGVATFTTTTLATGKHSITASYGGNTSYLSETSAAVTVTVTAK